MPRHTIAANVYRARIRRFYATLAAISIGNVAALIFQIMHARFRAYVGRAIWRAERSIQTSRRRIELYIAINNPSTLCHVKIIDEIKCYALRLYIIRVNIILLIKFLKISRVALDRFRHPKYLQIFR